MPAICYPGHYFNNIQKSLRLKRYNNNISREKGKGKKENPPTTNDHYKNSKEKKKGKNSSPHISNISQVENQPQMGNKNIIQTRNFQHQISGLC